MVKSLDQIRKDIEHNRSKGRFYEALTGLIEVIDWLISTHAPIKDTVAKPEKKPRKPPQYKKFVPYDEALQRQGSVTLSEEELKALNKKGCAKIARSCYRSHLKWRFGSDRVASRRIPNGGAIFFLNR